MRGKKKSTSNRSMNAEPGGSVILTMKKKATEIGKKIQRYRNTTVEKKNSRRSFILPTSQKSAVAIDSNVVPANTNSLLQAEYSFDERRSMGPLPPPPSSSSTEKKQVTMRKKLQEQNAKLQGNLQDAYSKVDKAIKDDNKIAALEGDITNMKMEIKELDADMRMWVNLMTSHLDSAYDAFEKSEDNYRKCMLDIENRVENRERCVNRFTVQSQYYCSGLVEAARKAGMSPNELMIDLSITWIAITLRKIRDVFAWASNIRKRWITFPTVSLPSPSDFYRSLWLPTEYEQPVQKCPSIDRTPDD